MTYGDEYAVESHTRRLDPESAVVVLVSSHEFEGGLRVCDLGRDEHELDERTETSSASIAH